MKVLYGLLFTAIALLGAGAALYKLWGITLGQIINLVTGFFG
jgi:hypothetical protein